ncbi:MAG: histidine kinase, partial [Bacteroidota bacterium]|nr:histidine kinase [Bacteroidota bacterium]
DIQTSLEAREERNFQAKKFRELLLKIHQKPSKEQQLELRNTFFDWKGNLEQVDDVCVMGVKW